MIPMTIKSMFIILIIAIFFIECSNHQQASINMKIVESFYNQIKVDSIEKIKLINLTNFKWDEVCIFPPYTPVDTVNAFLGEKWRLSSSTNLHTDTYCLIVFKKDSEIVNHTLYPRHKGDFSYLNTFCFNFNNAVFKIDKQHINGSVRYLIKDTSINVVPPAPRHVRQN